MAGTCSVCGSQFGAFGGALLSSRPEHGNYKICNTCYQHKEDMLDIKDVEGNAAYFAGFVGKVQDPVVKEYLVYLADTPNREAEKLKPHKENEAIAAEKTARLANIMVTSGFNFEGWDIAEYKGFISAEIAVGMGMFKAVAASFSNAFGTESESLGTKLSGAKQAVMERFLEKAVEQGGNAVIGIALNYTMFGDSLVGVIVSGTAVHIEKVAE